MQTSTKQQQNHIRMIDRIMSSDTEYHIATLNRYYPCFKSKSDNNVKFESIKRCQVTSSSVEDDEVMEEDTSNSIDVAMDEDKPSSPPADNGQIIKPSESVSILSSCYRRQRAVSYTDEELIQESTTHLSRQSSQTDTNPNRKVSFLDEISQSIISSISYRPTTSPDDKQTLYYTKEDYEMFSYDEYTERILLEKEEEEEKVFSWEDLLCYDGVGSDYCIHMMADEEVEGDKLMHKVETVKDLLI